MNKGIYLFFFLTFMVQVSFAQLTISAEVGTNYSNLEWRNSNRIPNTSPGLGGFLSFTPSYKLTNRIAAKIEIQESFERYTYNSFFIKSSFFNFVRIIPQVEIESFSNLNISLGVSYGFKVLESNVDNPVPIPFPGAENKVLRHDISSVFGLNYQIGNVFVSAKYVLGFNDIAMVFVADRTGTLFVGEEVGTSILQLGVGYKFDISHFLEK